MKSGDRKRIARALRAAVPQLREKGRLLAVTPRGRILRGLYLEDSSEVSRFYVWAFVQPLYAPSPTISFNLGKRLGGPSKSWSISEPGAVVEAVKDEGLDFIQPVSTPEALASWSFLDGRSDPYASEAKAYSLVADGRNSEGAKALRGLSLLLTGGVPWMLEMKQRAEQLADLVEVDPDSAQRLLSMWESETASVLRVQDLL